MRFAALLLAAGITGQMLIPALGAVIWEITR
jgi:hypothetical protein